MKCTIEFTSRSSAILTNGLTFVSCSRLVTTILNFFRGICHGPLGIDFSVAFSFSHKFLKWLPKDLAMWKTRVVLFGPKMICLRKCIISAIKRYILELYHSEIYIITKIHQFTFLLRNTIEECCSMLTPAGNSTNCIQSSRVSPKHMSSWLLQICAHGINNRLMNLDISILQQSIVWQNDTRKDICNQNVNCYATSNLCSRWSIAKNIISPRISDQSRKLRPYLACNIYRHYFFQARMRPKLCSLEYFVYHPK